MITGGGSGIGLATARRFRAEGAKVVVVDVNAEAGEAAADEVDGEFVAVDVTDEAARTGSLRARRSTYGSVDIAFNNAGISPPDDDSILDTGLDAWERVQRVNLTSVYLCCKYAIPHMLRAQGKGSIINTASFVAMMGAATSQISYTRQQGRRARDDTGAGRAVRPGGRPRQRALPRAGEHAAAAGAVREGPGAGRPAARAHPDGPVRRARRRSPPRSRSWPATIRRS